MQLFISTGLNKRFTTSELINKFKKINIKNIELSSGLYERDIFQKLKKIKETNFLLHNYFPVPKHPFTINLASKNNIIVNRSLKHLKRSILYSSKLNIKYFSFHAGYLVDPKIEELGKVITKQVVNERKDILKLFIKRLNLLSKYAKNKGVMILLENNVVTKKNLNRFNKNPFLMTTFNETKKIMLSTDDNIKLLIDVGHLKVTAKTLKFDPTNYIKKLNKWTEAYHLSDNNGIKDQNNNLTSKSWFWKHLKSNVKFYTLELKDLRLYNIKLQLKLCKKKLKNNIYQ